MSNFAFPYSNKAWAKRIHEIIHERTRNLIRNATVLGRGKYGNNDELWRDVKDAALASIAREDRSASRGPVMDHYQEISGYCVNCSTFGLDSPIIYTVTIWDNGDYAVDVRCRMNCKHPLVPPNWKPPEKKPTPPSHAYLSLQTDAEGLWYNHFLGLVEIVKNEIQEEAKQWEEYEARKRKEEKAKKRRERALQEKAKEKRKAEQKKEIQNCVFFLTVIGLGAIVIPLLLFETVGPEVALIAGPFFIILTVLCRIVLPSKSSDENRSSLKRKHGNE